MKEGNIYNLLLAHSLQITPKRYHELVPYFFTPKTLWQASKEKLLKVGIKSKWVEDFIDCKKNINLDKVLEDLKKENIKYCFLDGDDYPEFLKKINDPPLVLFYKGSLDYNFKKSIAVVGTRNCSLYGKQACENICTDLAQNKMTIISGLALGIDGIAHKTAIANNAKTMAVLGTGISKNSIYPKEHCGLVDKIISSGGAVVSEYPPHIKGTRFTFPARNRIIAGLSRGTLVIEAPFKSGALITARVALDYNRDVFIIPHNITSTRGQGCNHMIQNGAIITLRAKDILNEFGIEADKKENTKVLLDEVEQKIFACLSDEPKLIDFIIKETCLDSPMVLGKLTVLEMKKIVKNVGGGSYILA